MGLIPINYDGIYLYSIKEIYATILNIDLLEPHQAINEPEPLDNELSEPEM